jgi:hypothetical protein
MKTLNRFSTPTPNGQHQDDQTLPIQAAAYVLKPRQGQDSREAARIIDIMLQGDAAHDAQMAWYFYNKIPELRYIARYVANSLSQARLFVGKVNADPFNPSPVGPRHPANQLLDNFAGGFEGQSELLDRLGLHLTVAGDSIIAGPEVGKTPPPPFDQWRVYSTQELYSRQGIIYYRKASTGRDEPLPPGVVAVRIWRPHPQRWERADSPVLSSFTVLREIDLLDQHVHASAVSRLAGAGLLLLPDEITFPADEVETEGIEVDPFIKHLTEVMSIAIKNRESAAAMVPIMLRGSAEAIAAIRHLTFSTPFDDKVPDLRNVALRRLALGMDVPPEVLLGMSESTQWSAWQTDESTVRLHTVPLLQLIANALTVGWFRPALEKMRLSDAVSNEISNLTVWFDTSNLAVRPNKSEESQALYDRFEADGSILRLTSGLTEADKPTKNELEEQILLFLIRNNTDLAAYAINTLTERGTISLPEAESPSTFPVGRPSTPAEQTDIVVADTTPGQRSQDRQSAPPPGPTAQGDESNNQVGAP